LLIRRRTVARSGAAILEKTDPAEAWLTLTLHFTTGLLRATTLVVTTTTLLFAVGVAFAIGLLELIARPLMLRIGLTFFAVTPTLVVALNETTLGLDHPKVMVGVLPVRLP